MQNKKAFVALNLIHFFQYWDYITVFHIREGESLHVAVKVVESTESDLWQSCLTCIYCGYSRSKSPKLPVSIFECVLTNTSDVFTPD